jgi:hypothetical protein
MIPPHTEPVNWVRELEFAYDYSQVYLYDREPEWSDDASEYEAALEAAIAARSSVGVAAHVVDVQMPAQYNFEAPLRIEGWPAEPPCDLDEWDHAVEFPLELPSGELMLEAAGGTGETTVELPAGSYRARWSGRGFDVAADRDVEEMPDEYRLQLWPEDGPEEPTELKRWPGYDVIADAE